MVFERHLSSATDLATNVLKITSTLSVAVSGTILGTSGVGRVALLATIRLHSDEVEGCVQAALNSRQVNVECQLIALEGEGLVLVGARHEVET